MNYQHPDSSWNCFFPLLSIQSERIRRIRSGGDAVNQKSGMMRQYQPGQPEPKDGRLDPTKDGPIQRWAGWTDERVGVKHIPLILKTFYFFSKTPDSCLWLKDRGVFVTALVPNSARIALMPTERYLKDRMQCG